MILFYGYLFYYVAALMGVSVGYHRYFSHRTFKTNRFVEIVMLMFGLICGGRSPLTWCAVHRMHHSTSDTDKDPHSPVYKGAKAVILSKWRVNYIPRKYMIDLIRNPRVMFFHNYGIYLYLTYALCTLFLGFDAFLIFCVIPFVLAYFSFGLLNYITHRTGEPQDVPMMNLLAPGEGWHKHHHQHPMASSLHTFDPAGLVIKCLA
jgi:stearoyl-CoA desaturase (delta-9 desaturase)